jgi:molybdate-binding protein
VVAGCDPVLGLVAALVERTSPHRLVCAHASTGDAVTALAAGRVHGVVVHAVAGDLPPPPVAVRRWHLARWQVGLASGRRSGPPTVAELAERRPRVVQREAGAGTQRALERALAAVGAPPGLPGPVGSGHLDVARRLAQGPERVGVTMEAAARAYSLGFTPLEAHAVELWLDERWCGLPGAVALVEVLTGASFRRRAGLLDYDLSACGTAADAG